jgi:hypothetical protein
VRVIEERTLGPSVGSAEGRAEVRVTMIPTNHRTTVFSQPGILPDRGIHPQ